MVVGGIIVIVCMIVAGILYADMWRENRDLRLAIEDNNGYQQPIKYIMVGNKNSAVASLATIDIQAHLAVGVGITKTVEKEGYQRIVFENKDELIIYTNIAVIKSLTTRERNECVLKVFVDYEMPQGTERAVIEKLGLIDYMVTLGVCRKKVEVKYNGTQKD